MSWIRLDDRGAFHTKTVRAGNAAYGVWIRCLQLCGLNDTRGFVPIETAVAVAGPDQALLARLTEVRLWVPVQAGDKFCVTERKDTGRRDLPDVEVTIPSDGFWIRDFLHFNRTDQDTERSPNRSTESSTYSVQTSSAHHAHTSADNARASPAQQDVQQMRAPPRPDPSRPEYDRTPSRARAALASAGGRSANEQTSEAPASPSPPEAPSAPPSEGEQAIVDRLRDLGWRSKQRANQRFAGAVDSIALRMIREQNLTLDALDRLVALAKVKTKGDPMDLVGTWVHPGGAAWKDVLADSDERRRHAAAVERGRVAQATLNGETLGNGQLPRAIGERQ